MNSFRRPQSIFGLLVRLLGARRFVGISLGGACLFVAIVAATVGTLRGCPLEPLRVATFNIEDFPKSERQVEGAFELIGELGSPIIAVQEITDPVAFSRAAHDKLGRSWRFVYNRRGGRHKLGVLFDGERFELVRTRQHDDTTLGEGHRPTLEVVLDPRDGDRRTRVVVVHLKAGGENVPIRRRQLEALEGILERVLGSEDRVIVLGDFNATGPEDRAAIFDMAERSEMVWLSESLECTSYWERPDECQGSALDHVLIDAIPFSIAARGPCETEGCDTRESCPIFHREVSDHCPVVAEVF